AMAAARMAPAPALKSHAALDAELAAQAGTRGRLLLIGAAAIVVVAALLLPPIDGTPIFAYLAIAAVLVGTIATKPVIAPGLLRPLARAVAAGRRPPVPSWLALQRLAATPRFAAIGVAGVSASFALMIAMATMVTSFRASVDAWLGQMLPADLYVRAAPPGVESNFPASDLARIAAADGVARVDFGRTRLFSIDPEKPPLTLIARRIDRQDPGRTLPIVAIAPGAAPGAAVPAPAYVSEAAAALHGLRLGDTIAMALAGHDTAWRIAGTWRDYARQGGSVAVDIDDYRRATGDATCSEAALWIAPGHSAQRVGEELAARLLDTQAVIAAPGEIRAVTLRVFDRSFAVTNLVEVAAIAIGLAGIGATFSVQAITRRHEFGVLRHVGVTRRQILLVLAIESLVATLLAVALGTIAGLGAAAILVDVVNPQSFHWTMDLRFPWPTIGALAGATLAAAVATAVVAGRGAIAADAVLAVREDW
ncbi:MAG TPA: ABC transporter permease, partial [Burkholderiaceae bacterium]|nr:ABC transporter permease [Burkholderiaceae bacterium]